VSTRFTQDDVLEQGSVWGDEYCVSADEVALIEDLQEIEHMYSRKSAAIGPAVLLDSNSLGFWGLDLSERLNDGELTVENIVNKFRVSLDGQDHIAFAPVGSYTLSLEREGGDAWTPFIHSSSRETKKIFRRGL
jgi:hypothetical protein